MNGLEFLRQQCHRPADAVRWACLLEATAPKPGNVSPGRDFSDLRYQDFVVAAELTADAFESERDSFSRSILAASESIASRLATNVNLGILLLLAPLAQVDQSAERRLSRSTWQAEVSRLLSGCDDSDCQRVYRAIAVSKPGGMGQVEHGDVSEPPTMGLIDAMKLAQDRDSIARNYANGFQSLFHETVPIVQHAIETRGDVLAGISEAAVQLLRTQPDSLILRKNGAEVAGEVQRWAEFPFDNEVERERFDRKLRASDFNPGTTADLIAASLYILLREK